jgi:predicted secreted hydrolase
MPLAYWEGAVEIEGTRDGGAIKGRGYLELTGYAGPLRELQR